MTRGSRPRKTTAPTSVEIERLLAFLPLLSAVIPIRRWGGGEKTEDGGFVMPWPVYDELVKEFFAENPERRSDKAVPYLVREWGDSAATPPVPMLNWTFVSQVVPLTALPQLVRSDPDVIRHPDEVESFGEDRLLR